MAQTKFQLAENYKDYTDKYFLRTKQILEAERINPVVRYQVFVRKPGIVKGLDEAVRFIKNVVGNKVKVYALKDGQEYASCEPLIKIEGRVQELVELETVYLGLISGALTEKIDMQEVRKKARAIYQAAQGKKLYYFGARHFSPCLDEQIAKICFEEGFNGCSTDIGAKAWDAKGMGTIPHALIMSYAAYMQEQGIQRNATVESAKAFDRNIPAEVPRIVLIDTFNREITDTLKTAKAVPSLAGVRIDTCGENYAQGSKEIVLPRLNVNPKYSQGKGVTITAVWQLRKAMLKNKLGNLELVVSSGFDEKKTAAFVEADRVFQAEYSVPLFTAVGTGSIANPTMATSDVVAYYSEKEATWKEMHKTGRCEIQTSRLREVK